MTNHKDADQAAERLERLLGYLEADPGNADLLFDAAGTAIDARQPAQAVELLDRIAAARELGDAELHLLGLAAMHLHEHDRAASIFRSLLDREADGGGGVRFNLAWALFKGGDQEAALPLVDEGLAAALPQAAMLRVQLLHAKGAMAEAEAAALQAVEHHPDHRGLLAAVSVLAIDLEDSELAARCAAAAGDHPDALTTLGTLALEGDDPAQALDLFERALAHGDAVPRAWVGRGLARLSDGQASAGAADIDRGAQMFGDHLGSWIAAGWAHFISRDLVAARERFERALELDPSFAESHGSLAVLELLDGRKEEAKRLADVAVRLDRQCYSAALALVLMRADAGDAAGAERIFARAIETPVDASGRTIGQAMARIGARAG